MPKLRELCFVGSNIVRNDDRIFESLKRRKRVLTRLKLRDTAISSRAYYSFAALVRSGYLRKLSVSANPYFETFPLPSEPKKPFTIGTLLQGGGQSPHEQARQNVLKALFSAPSLQEVRLGVGSLGTGDLFGTIKANFTGRKLELTGFDFKTVSNASLKETKWACSASLEIFSLSDPLNATTDKLRSLVSSLKELKNLKDLNLNGIGSLDGLSTG